MLLNVHIAPSVIEETSQSTAQFAAPALRRELVELLLRHGVLRFTSGREAGLWIDSLSRPDLSPAEKKQWQQLLLTLKQQGRLSAADPALVDDPEGAGAVGDLQGFQQAAPLLSVLGTNTYRKIFPTARAGRSEAFPGVEIAVAGSVSESQQYRALLNLVEAGSFPRGTPRVEVWNRLLGPLSSVSKEIVIFDKYLFSRLFETADEQVTWLLAQLDRVVPEGAVVKLYAARGTPGAYGSEQVPADHREAEARLREYLPKSFQRIGALEIVLAESGRARHMHHDRYIRFGSAAAVELPSGFDRLEPTRLREDFGFTYRSAAAAVSGLASREQVVRGGRGTHLVTI